MIVSPSPQVVWRLEDLRMVDRRDEARTRRREYRRRHGDERWHRPGCEHWPNDNEDPKRRFLAAPPEPYCEDCRGRSEN